MGEITQFSLIGLLVACTVVNLAASVLLARASLPMRLRKWRERADTHIDELTVIVDDVNKRSKLWESTLEGLIEEAGNAFQRAERKRASAASAVSKQGAAAAQVPDLSAMSRSDRIDFQRRRLAGG